MPDGYGEVVIRFGAVLLLIGVIGFVSLVRLLYCALSSMLRTVQENFDQNRHPRRAPVDMK